MRFLTDIVSPYVVTLCSYREATEPRGRSKRGIVAVYPSKKYIYLDWRIPIYYCARIFFKSASARRRVLSHPRGRPALAKSIRTLATNRIPRCVQKNTEKTSLRTSASFIRQQK